MWTISEQNSKDWLLRLLAVSMTKEPKTKSTNFSTLGRKQPPPATWRTSAGSPVRTIRATSSTMCSTATRTWQRLRRETPRVSKKANSLPTIHLMTIVQKPLCTSNSCSTIFSLVSQSRLKKQLLSLPKARHSQAGTHLIQILLLKWPQPHRVIHLQRVWALKVTDSQFIPRQTIVQTTLATRIVIIRGSIVRTKRSRCPSRPLQVDHRSTAQIHSIWWPSSSSNSSSDKGTLSIPQDHQQPRWFRNSSTISCLQNRFQNSASTQTCNRWPES